MQRYFFLFILFCSSLFCFNQDILLIGIAGGTASGKTTLANTIAETFQGEVILIAQDNYYKPLGHLPFQERANQNFDHPDAIDFDLLHQHLVDLKNAKGIEMPIYNFSIHSRENQVVDITPKKIVIVEGILIFVDERIRDLFDVKLYVSTDDDIRLLRRIERDIKERSRSFECVKKQYLTTVAPMHKLFVEPTKKYADFIVPGNIDNHIAAKLIIENLKTHIGTVKK